MMTGGDHESQFLTPPREQIQHTIDALAEHKVALVNLQFSDISGASRTVTVPTSLVPRVFQRGYRFDGAAMAGGERTIELDLFLQPDPTTLTIFPCLTDRPRSAQLFCWVTRRGGQPFAGDPRSCLQRVLTRASDLGFDYRAGIELEYYLYRGASVAEAMLSGKQGPSGYFADENDAAAGARNEIVATLHELGVGVHGAHHETGFGQEELDLRHSGGIRVADQLVTTRRAIRQIAQSNGFRATFMAKPFADLPGSGMHIFQRLHRLSDKTDLLTADANTRDVSQTALQMIAGQLTHAPAMSLIMNTTVNSYKRLADGHRAPAWATWAHVTAASLLRVPRVADVSTPTDIELRSPDPLANPYLAVAVALGAALDGIERKMNPPAPFDEDLVAYDEEVYSRFGATRLPQTLGEAIAVFAEDDAMRSILGPYIHDQLISVKRAEWAAFRRHVSPWEHAQYGDQ